MTPIDPAILAEFVEKFGQPRKECGPTKHGYLQEGFVAGYQLCAAEKQQEIDAFHEKLRDALAKLEASVQEKALELLDQYAVVETLNKRIATLEQQRQQDREDIIGERDECGDSCCIATCNNILEQFDARAKEPHHD